MIMDHWVGDVFLQVDDDVARVGDLAPRGAAVVVYGDGGHIAGYIGPHEPADGWWRCWGTDDSGKATDVLDTHLSTRDQCLRSIADNEARRQPA